MTEILRALHFTHLRIHFLKLFRTAFIIEQLSARKNQGWVGSMLGRMENNAECDQFVSALSGREFLARCGATFLKGLTTGHVDMSVQWFCASYPDVIARMFKQPGFPQELYSLLNNGIYCLTPSIERQKRFRRNAMYDYIAITMMDETIPACDDDLIKLLSGFSFTYLIFRMNDAGLNKMRGVLNTSEKLKQVLFYDMQVPICDIEILDEQMQGICRFFGKPPIRSSRDVVETLCCVDVGSRSAVINLLFRADRPSWFDRAASEDITAVMEVRSVALYNKVTRDLLCDYAASCPQGSSALQRGFFSSQNVVDPIPSVSSIIRDALADENNKIPEDYVRAIKARLVTDEKADELLLELNHILALIENMVSNSVSCSVFASDTFVRGCLRN